MRNPENRTPTTPEKTLLEKNAVINEWLKDGGIERWVREGRIVKVQSATTNKPGSVFHVMFYIPDEVFNSLPNAPLAYRGNAGQGIEIYHSDAFGRPVGEALGSCKLVTLNQEQSDQLLPRIESV